MLAFESGHLEVACLLLEACSPALMLTSASEHQEVARLSLLLAVNVDKGLLGACRKDSLDTATIA